MNWFTRFLTSSLGRKLIMSLTGLFLISFLIIHAMGNLPLVFNDDGASFTAFVHFMESNFLISKILAMGLYAGFIIHMIQGWMIWSSNRKARGGQKYAVNKYVKVTWTSRNMALLGTLVFFFLVVHMGDFFVPLKVTGVVPEHDLYQHAMDKFKNPLYLIIYELGIAALFLHLTHGFQSAFQTLGLNHKKYTPVVKALGWAYSIIIPGIFAFIPLYIFFIK